MGAHGLCTEFIHCEKKSVGRFLKVFYTCRAGQSDWCENLNNDSSVHGMNFQDDYPTEQEKILVKELEPFQQTVECFVLFKWPNKDVNRSRNPIVHALRTPERLV